LWFRRLGWCAEANVRAKKEEESDDWTNIEVPRHHRNPSTERFAPCHRAYPERVKRRISSLLFVVLFSQLGVGQPPPSLAPAQQQPASIEVLQNQLEHGQTQEAIAGLQKLAASPSPVKGANRILGIAYYRSGKLVEAEKAFAKAMDEDPADIESVQMRGLSLYRLGQPAAAIQFLERVRQWTPDAGADANYVLGLCYMNSQRYDEARGAFAAQYGVSADSAAAYLIMGQMLSHADLPELAAKAAQKAVDISPKLPLAHFLLGEVALYKSDPQHALEQFEQEREINPAYPPVYDRLGDVYTRTAQYQQAQEALMKAISLDQASTGPFIQMGKVLLRRNDPGTATLYLKHAAKMDPSNYITHTLLAQAYRSLGEEDEAKKEFDTAEKIHSTSQLKLQPVQ
jgi:tetratricopeptide (TPR) repeat protein